MTSCRQVYQHICDHLDEDLASPRCRRIRQHLEGCPDCQAYLDSLKKTIILYRSAPSPRVPPVVHRALAKALEREQTRSGPAKRAQRRAQSPRSGRSSC
jgi:anti-sigma factor RsiW